MKKKVVNKANMMINKAKKRILLNETADFQLCRFKHYVKGFEESETLDHSLGNVDPCFYEIFRELELTGEGIEGSTYSIVSEALAHAAKKLSEIKTLQVNPFNLRAIEFGRFSQGQPVKGGKKDDISVIVSGIVDRSAEEVYHNSNMNHPTRFDEALFIQHVEAFINNFKKV